MTISLNSHYEVTTDFKIIGYVGETNARTITFEGLAVEGAERYVMRIEYPDGISYEIEIIDGSYTVEGSVLREECRIKCQILALKANGDQYTLVKKSDVFTLNIKRSLEGEPAPVPTYEALLSLMETFEQKLVVANFGEFPEAGIEGSIYAAEDKRMFYSWNSEEGRYIPYSFGEGGTGDYELLINLPTINGRKIIGDKTEEEYGIEAVSNEELEKILK